MLLVALTGGIATGKSYVRARVAARGVPTIDSDQVVHELLRAGTVVSGAIAERFGRPAVRADGSVDRRVLGRLVFADPAARADLEAIVHPRVYERIAEWAGDQRRAAFPWALADVPLLFETGRQGDFDLVVVVACPPSLQLSRVRERDGLSESDARARIASQWSIDRKARLADYVISTGGSFEETDRQVDNLITDINGKVKTENGKGLP